MKLYRFLDPSIDSLDEGGLVERCSMLLLGTKPGGGPRGGKLAEVYRAQRVARGDDASPAETWLAISTDYFFRCGALKLAELQPAHTPDVFVYEFAWKGTTPGKPQGVVVHPEPVPVLEIGAIAGRTPSARALSASVQEAWLTFARTGRPRSASLPDWPCYAPPRRATLELGVHCRVLEAPREIERALCDELVG